MLHSDEIDAIRLIDVINRNDVGMVQRRGRPCFLHKAPLALRVGDLLGRQYLEGDEALQMAVAGLVDHAHTALAELFGDFVVRDGAADHEPPGYSGPFQSDQLYIRVDD